MEWCFSFAFWIMKIDWTFLQLETSEYVIHDMEYSDNVDWWTLSSLVVVGRNDPFFCPALEKPGE